MSGAVAVSPKARLLSVIDRSLPALREVAPRHLTPERVLRTVRILINTNPTLALCYPATVVVGILRAAEMGLEVGSGFNHAYLVPFRNDKRKRMEAQLIIGYQGYIELALRTGKIDDVNSIPVFKEDRFNYQEGTTPKVEHWPEMDGPRNKASLIRVYSRVHMLTGFFRTHMMTAAQVEATRLASKAGRDNRGPWKDHYLEMARKTPLRADAKYWPKTRELATAIETEEIGDGLYEDETLAVVEELTSEAEAKTPEPEPAEATDLEVDQRLAGES